MEQQKHLLLNRMTFAATAGAPRLARAFVRHALESWLLADLAADAELIVTELVTNSVRATGSTGDVATYEDVQRVPVVGVQVRMSGPVLFIEVWDNDNQVPAPRPQDPPDGDALAERGRGLGIVHALTDGHCGYDMVRKGGKVVWAELWAGATTAWIGRMTPLPLPHGFRGTAAAEDRPPVPHTAMDLAFLERSTGTAPVRQRGFPARPGTCTAPAGTQPGGDHR